MTFIGRGKFGWERAERVSNRYGSFSLYGGGKATPLSEQRRNAEPFDTKMVRVVARVEATRQSHHIGDLFLGISPSTPKVGEEMEVAVGTLYVEDGPDQTLNFVIEPNDGREELWIDPKVLYRLHDQTVIVFMELR